jgi:zinc D-Ala-D-Ala carboxypeptidase
MRARQRLRSALLTLLMTATALVGISFATAAPAQADGCYTWSRQLSQGATGSDVSQLQIRVAGWAGYGVSFSVDGNFGPATRQAVVNFQNAYGLPADGVAGTNTFNQIYALQDDDCTPLHFSWSEVDGGCGQGGYSGGNVSAATVQNNLLQAMWRAEALRQRLGNRPLTVTSGFRSVSCDKAVDGSGTGYHTYGMAIDLVGSGGSPSFCSIAQQARYTGYNGILGPGYPGHYDHVHVDIRSSRFWDASDCGVTS